MAAAAAARRVRVAGDAGRPKLLLEVARGGGGEGEDRDCLLVRRPDEFRRDWCVVAVVGGGRAVFLTSRGRTSTSMRGLGRAPFIVTLYFRGGVAGRLEEEVEEEEEEEELVCGR